MLLRKYTQIHPNRSTCEPKVRIEVCVMFFFHFMKQRLFFCYFHVFRLSLSINGIIWVSSLPSVRLQVNVFLSFTIFLSSLLGLGRQVRHPFEDAWFQTRPVLRLFSFPVGKPLTCVFNKAATTSLHFSRCLSVSHLTRPEESYT